MPVIAFDCGGVLWNSQANHCSNCAPIVALYKTLIASPDWRVIIVTCRTRDEAPECAADALRERGIPQPDVLEVTYPGDSKGPIYAKHEVDVVIDDGMPNLCALVETRGNQAMPLLAIHQV